jgi:transcription termination factor Rho
MGEGRYNPTYGQRSIGATPGARTVDVTGVFWAGGGQGLSPAELLDGRNLQPIARFNPEEARRMGLRSGDLVQARAEERGGRRTVVGLESVNGVAPERLMERPVFEQLTATFPDRRIRLEQGTRAPLSTRIMDLFSPLGFGSRALIVAPPKTGKTTLIREAAEAVLTGYPDAVVMAVLVGERPDTGSRQDDVVYEEFKGTGNMELHLSRELSQRRIFPSVDVVKSGTRREEMLLSPEELRAATMLRRRLADMQPAQATEQLLKFLERAPSNAALIQALESSGMR